MFSQELASLTALVSAAFDRLQIPHPEQIQWIPIPLAGQWGFGTAVAFQAAALEAKRGDAIQVPARAQEIASQLAAELLGGDDVLVDADDREHRHERGRGDRRR